MFRSAMLRSMLALHVAVFCACAPTAQVSRGDGADIVSAQNVDARARPRVVVAAVLDRSRERELDLAVAALNRSLPTEALLTSQQLLSGVRDLLTTELFVADRFIVLERVTLDAVLAEQAFAADEQSALALPAGTLEGADFLVVGAITAIDPGLDGGALPIPFPIGDEGFGVLGVRAGRGYIAMDLRVIDARSGRVLNATSVEGRHWRFGIELTGYFDIEHGYVEIPGLLRFFRNTPLEAALQRMSATAVERIAESAQP